MMLQYPTRLIPSFFPSSSSGQFPRNAVLMPSVRYAKPAKKEMFQHGKNKK